MGRKEEEEKKKLKEGEPSVRFQDEPRPSAPRTQRPRCLPGFFRRGQTPAGSPCPGARTTFPPVVWKDFSPAAVVVTLKIRGRFIRPLPLHAPHTRTFGNAWEGCIWARWHFSSLFPRRVLVRVALQELVGLNALEARAQELLVGCTENSGLATSPRRLTT